MKLFLLTAAAVLAAAPVCAMPHHANNVRTSHIHRAQRDMQKVMQARHFRVSFTPEAQKQRGKGYQHAMRCTGGTCTTAIHYIK